ncbi:MAG: hypothetical protein ACLSU9_10785 [Anaerovoracaceae bacterium]
MFSQVSPPLCDVTITNDTFDDPIEPTDDSISVSIIPDGIGDIF